ncbi:YkvA family protein [Aeromonas hydrophila]|uniref:YkvA family protein n=1 Tax=Aeromonas hydrophila TaxID=644 RepID=UPI001115E6E9|nr:hypothetical protein CF141_04150 [Aeromonas hydrophila]
MIGALAYLVNPFDVVPDPIPFAGYLDDLSVITSALAALPVKSHHRQSAKDRMCSGLIIPDTILGGRVATII